MDTSSRTKLNRLALLIRFSLTRRDTWNNKIRSMAHYSPCAPPSIITHHLSLRDQLTGVKLRHHGLEHFIHDGREHTLIVVSSKLSVAEKKSGETNQTA